jgi:surface antigen
MIASGNIPTHLKTACAVLATVFAVSGCTTSGSAVTPLSFASPVKPGNADSGDLLAALNGGVLPSGAVASLSKTDRLRALEAEYKALESAPGGLPVAWKSFDGRTSGQVIAATPYQVGQQNCRQYTHSAVVRGQTVTGQGAACRNADGSWTPLT